MALKGKKLSDGSKDSHEPAEQAPVKPVKQPRKQKLASSGKSSYYSPQEVEAIKAEQRKASAAARAEDAAGGYDSLGRGSDKIPDVHYVKLCARVTFETRRRIATALLRQKDEFYSQDALVDFALRYYLDAIGEPDYEF